MDQLELGCRQEGSVPEAGSQEHDHFWGCVTEEGTGFNIQFALGLLHQTKER